MAEMSNDTRREQELRAWNKILSLWHLCDNAACTRARTCRGNVRLCAPRNFALLPDGVQGWFACVAMGQEEGLTFDETLRRIDETSAAQAFEDWNTAVAAARGERARASCVA